MKKIKKLTNKLLFIILISEFVLGYNKIKPLTREKIALKYNKNISTESTDKTKKVIVIGATSGMGRQVTKLFSEKGYIVGAAGRREALLENLKNEAKNQILIKQIDVTNHEEARNKIFDFIKELGGLDLMFISISGWNDKAKTSWEYNKHLIETDVLGFFVAADTALEYFTTQGYGHLAGISSIDGLRGNAICPTYSGTKSFVATYLEGVRNYMKQNKIPITITNIIPGWVDNETVQYSQIPGTYWVSSTQKAAKQIVNALEKKKEKAYITKRWILVAKLLEWLPDCIYNASWWPIR